MKTTTRAKLSTLHRPEGRPLQLLPCLRRIRKPRAPWGFRSKLTEAQKQTLFRWLAIDAMAYDAAIVRVLNEFGIRASLHALSLFWYAYCSPRLLQERPQLPQDDLGVSTPVQQAPGEFSMAIRANAMASGEDSNPAFGGEPA